MSRDTPCVQIAIGATLWTARLRRDLAPRSCAALEALLPYRGKLLHARWSGEACWAPLGPAWPSGRLLAPERATTSPEPSEMLLYAGEQSEPELLLPYGACRFACRAGPLAGNPVLTLEGPPGPLADLGREVLWGGAMDLRIDLFSSNEAPRDIARPGDSR